MSAYLQLTSQCNRNNFPVSNYPLLVYVLTELQPGNAAIQARIPLNFSLVLDRSGSMAGEKIRNMREAVKQIIDQLQPDDVVSVVTFETKTQVLVPARLATDLSAIKKEIDKISDAGGTVMAPGIREGLNQLKKFASPDRTSRIILLTDGEATDQDENAPRNEADYAASMNIPIIGLGFGKDYKVDFVLDLADRSVAGGGGKAWDIKTPADAIKVFDDVYASMQVVAKDVTVNIRMAQGLEARRVWQVVPMIKEIGRDSIQGRAIVIPVGELDKGGGAYLAEIMLPPRAEGSFRIAQTDATYSVMNAGPQRDAIDLVVNFTTNPSLSNEVNGRVMNIVEKVQAFKLQTQALSDAEMGNKGAATQKLRQAVTILLSQGETELANQIAQEANNLEQGGQVSSEGRKTIKLTSNKTVKLADND